MNVNKDTIIYGSLAVVGLYLFFKGEVSAGVKAVEKTVSTVYTPVRDASSSFGSGVYNVTHPTSATAQSNPIVQFGQSVGAGIADAKHTVWGWLGLNG